MLHKTELPKNPSLVVWLGLLCLVTLAAACGTVPTSDRILEQTPRIPGLEGTLAAQTIAADPYLLALVRTPTPSPELPTHQPTTAQNQLQASQEPAALTALPSLTPISQTLTPSIDPLYANALCNLAEFIQDLTIPDDAIIAPGQEFVKIWQLKNIGSCVWTTGYAAVLVWGNEFGTHSPIPLERAVAPGELIDLAIRMVAPSTPDCFQSNWMLQDEQGNRFGTGDSAKNTFWIAVSVWAPNLGLPLKTG